MKTGKRSKRKTGSWLHNIKNIINIYTNECIQNFSSGILVFDSIGLIF